MRIMKEDVIREIRISADGEQVGSVHKVYSTTATLEGDTSEFLNLLRGDEAEREALEAQWLSLPEEVRSTCCQCAVYVASILFNIGAHMLTLPLANKDNTKSYTTRISIEEYAD